MSPEPPHPGCIPNWTSQVDVRAVGVLLEARGLLDLRITPVGWALVPVAYQGIPQAPSSRATSGTLRSHPWWRAAVRPYPGQWPRATQAKSVRPEASLLQRCGREQGPEAPHRTGASAGSCLTLRPLRQGKFRQLRAAQGQPSPSQATLRAARRASRSPAPSLCTSEPLPRPALAPAEASCARRA